jgi:hypothetical protein
VCLAPTLPGVEPHPAAVMTSATANAHDVTR